ncbi:hypothetical protein [Streptomyces sp. NPDC050263]|uniref:hypothetical protein n=1 Tax=Streptomyces sp. NPDC050263 TaxID=3155037 RepID=UPI00343CC026
MGWLRVRLRLGAQFPAPLEFALSCLNRLQLRDNEQMVDLADPSGALQLIGTLKNPVTGF